MSPIDWATRPLGKYADFSGRAPRAELWWYVLMVCIAVLVALIVESAIGLAPVILFYGPLTLAVLVGTLVPTLAVQTRRLHDGGRSGYWLLAFYILYVGYMYLAVQNSGAVLSGASTPLPGDMSSLATLGIVAILLLLYSIVLIIFYVLPGTRGPNKYGDDPYAGGPARAM